MLDESVMSAYDKKGIEKFIGQKGFVIGRDRNLVDVRFGNDRTTVHARILTLLDQAVNPIENKKDDASKMDPMDPKSWDDV